MEEKEKEIEKEEEEEEEEGEEEEKEEEEEEEEGEEEGNSNKDMTCVHLAWTHQSTCDVSHSYMKCTYIISIRTIRAQELTISTISHDKNANKCHTNCTFHSH